jgi:lysyl-tRNA synthetase class 2
MTDHLPTAGAENVRRRAALLRRLRAFFDARGFVEVQTPLLSRDTVVDRHIDPVAVSWPTGGNRAPRTLYLQTSPEFAMKRMLAAGDESNRLEAIYQIGPAVRLGERGRLHNPEFTIVEWYRVGDDYHAGIRLLGEVAEETLGRGPAEAVTHADAFRRYVGVDPHTASTDELIGAVRRHGLTIPEGLGTDDRDAWIELLMLERVEPRLGCDLPGDGRPAILHDYPASQAMLARTRREPTGVDVAERFELYVDGIELANGYHELLDPAELRRRQGEANRRRRADGKPPLPAQSRLLDAMEAGLPPCTGCALGFDRLAMIALGADRIDRVIPFPIERA